MISASRSARAWCWLVRLALAVSIAAPALAAAPGADGAADVAVKAAFIYNFARFTEWPALSAGAPIVFCVVGDASIAGALVEVVRGQNIGGHSLDVLQPRESAAWPVCHLLYVADAEMRRSTEALLRLKTLPVLTVSDGRGFAEAGGVIELYVEGGRMRFAINVAAADRAKLRLSSRLLGLARVVGRKDGR